LAYNHIAAPTNHTINTMSDEPIPETAATAESMLNDGKHHASQAVNEIRAAAEAKAAELRATAEAKAAEFRATAEAKAAEFRSKAEHTYSDAVNRAQTFRGESEHWIRENPTRAVLTAMGVGFIIGLMFRK
jgi:ElaB/YqjD/DUF883 family membrane-anchored ribosome-binding protein